ncbi:hypothetical protein K440DRAFT_207859 [Wilcoxina mikolae CBS 423.85]|nr:hypothetical protein K440DRAFT_207859 [Wilcoxina mikolae CBS 423.85]
MGTQPNHLSNHRHPPSPPPFSTPVYLKKLLTLLTPLLSYSAPPISTNTSTLGLLLPHLSTTTTGPSLSSRCRLLGLRYLSKYSFNPRLRSFSCSRCSVSSVKRTRGRDRDASGVELERDLGGGQWGQGGGGVCFWVRGVRNFVNGKDWRRGWW